MQLPFVKQYNVDTQKQRRREREKKFFCVNMNVDVQYNANYIKRTNQKKRRRIENTHLL